MSSIKKTLVNHILATIDEQISHEKTALENITEAISDDQGNNKADSVDSATSSMQSELESIRQQIQDSLHLRTRVYNMPIENICSKVEPGALVYTSMDNFFLAINCDEIEIDGVEYLPISISSPLGQALKDRVVNDTVDFRGKKITITKIA